MVGTTRLTLPATASSTTSPQWTALTSSPAPISNPVKAFIQWAPEDGSAPGTVANVLPYTLEWATFPVNAVVTGRNTYDFKKVDTLHDAIASRGHQGVIRFYLDYPGRTTGMPRYLLDTGTDTSRQYDLHGNNKNSFSPNYDEPAVQEMMLRFVATLGEKYDGDPRIVYITAGVYGFWGEEHTYPYNGYVNDQNPKAINWMPSDEFRARLVEAWYEAFDDTFIQNRYPTAATKAHGMGYFDDSLGYATLEGTSRHFLPKLKERGEAEAWKSSPIGGELYPPIQECIFSQPLTCPNREAGRDYKGLESIQGVHAMWPLEVILVDENNKIVASQTIESTLSSILPGQSGRVTARLPLPPSKPARERPGPPDKGPRPLTTSVEAGSTSRGSAGSYQGVSGTGSWLLRGQIRPSRGMCTSCQRQSPPVGRRHRHTARSPRGSDWSRLPYPRGG